VLSTNETTSPKDLTRQSGTRESKESSSPAIDRLNEHRRPLSGGRWAFFFGIFVPAACYLVEVIFHGCSSLFFNPMPTIWHHIALLGVVFINAASWYAVRHDKSVPWLLVCGNRAVILISIFYGLVFLPVIPVALIGLIGIAFAGIGLLALLPLGPYFTLCMSLAHRRRLVMRQESGASRRPAWGYAVAALLVTLMTVPQVINIKGLQLATSENSATREKGLRILRNFGNRTDLLRSCYNGTGAFGDRSILSEIMPEISRRESREIYYRVTGEPFNQSLPGNRIFGRRAIAASWDGDIGGEVVGGRRLEVSLENSHMEMSLDPDAGLGYVEWILEFNNSGSRREEARCIMELPVDGVVSRVTLWINGIEQEAAYAGNTTVRRAYESVVRVSRDPVLVTSNGPGQVLVQCFPILPNNGKMKAKVGITFPLALQSRDACSVPLPRIIERNFQIDKDFHHEIEFASTVDIEESLGVVGSADTNISIGNSTLLKSGFVATVNRDSGIHTVTAADYVDPSMLVFAELVDVPPKNIQRLALIVDGSRSMEPHRSRIQKWVQELDLPYDLRVFIAHDRVLEGPQGEWPRFGGGCDNVPALARALEWAEAEHDSIVCWVHAPQPAKLSTLYRSKVGPRSPEIHHLQVGAGPNQVLSDLRTAGRVRRIMPSGNPVESLNSFVTSLSEPKSTWVYRSVESAGRGAPSPENATQASDHLVRLWKAQDIENQLQAGVDNELGLADEGARYQLVTSVSGAVVLESREQYEAAGLEPIDSSKAATHTVPEPGSLGLLILGGYWLILLRRRFGRKIALRELQTPAR